MHRLCRREGRGFSRRRLGRRYQPAPATFSPPPSTRPSHAAPGGACARLPVPASGGVEACCDIAPRHAVRAATYSTVRRRPPARAPTTPAPPRQSRLPSAPLRPPVTTLPGRGCVWREQRPSLSDRADVRAGTRPSSCAEAPPRPRSPPRLRARGDDLLATPAARLPGPPAATQRNA